MNTWQLWLLILLTILVGVFVWLIVVVFWEMFRLIKRILNKVETLLMEEIRPSLGICREILTQINETVSEMRKKTKLIKNLRNFCGVFPPVLKFLTSLKKIGEIFQRKKAH
jgi:predicted PurR-regulated permease PerM